MYQCNKRYLFLLLLCSQFSFMLRIGTWISSKTRSCEWLVAWFTKLCKAQPLSTQTRRSTRKLSHVCSLYYFTLIFAYFCTIYPCTCPPGDFVTQSTFVWSPNIRVLRVIASNLECSWVYFCREVLHHSHTANSKCENFVGRNEILNRIKFKLSKIYYREDMLAGTVIIPRGFWRDPVIFSNGPRGFSKLLCF